MSGNFRKQIGCCRLMVR